MRHRNSYILSGVLVVLLIAIVFDLSGVGGFTLNLGRPITVNQGLDLQGGVRVLLQAVPLDGQPPADDVMETTRQVILSRVSGGFGVTEPQVQVVKNGNFRYVSVELPGINVSLTGATPTSAPAPTAKVTAKGTATPGKTGARNGITSGGKATAKAGVGAASALTATATATSTAALSGTTPAAPPTSLQQVEKVIAQTGLLTLVQGGTTSQAVGASTKGLPTLAQGTDLDPKSVAIATDNLGQVTVDLAVNDPGKTRIATYTSAHFGENPRYYLPIAVDNKVVYDPYVKEPLTQGTIQIQVSTFADANNLKTILKYGALPVPLKIVSVSNVSASLGPANVRSSIIAGLVGLFIVVLFMTIYYRLPGLLANAALLIYALVSFALYKLIGVTFTLAGIAGFILSIGMAVDANILIFERMKEELRAGHSVGAAVEAGFARAWPSIRDSNISTMITCVILAVAGNSLGATIIVGFATTLGLGVLISMTTAFLVSRTFLRVVIATRRPSNRSLFGADALPSGPPTQVQGVQA